MSKVTDYDSINRVFQRNSPYVASDLFYANYSVERLMNLKKEIFVDESTVGQNSDGVPGAAKIDVMLGESGKAILKVAENLAAKKIIQTYYDQYMSPLASDIHYRLGTVSGVKATNITDVTNSSVSPNTAEYNKDNLILDNHGRIFTRSNFTYSFPVSLYSGARKTDIQYNVPYLNTFFPPFQRGGDITQSDKNFYKNLNAWREESNNNVASIATMDLNQYKCSRGNFTYREPAFKSINDNIQFLQYLLEQCTGVVSTYLTEWDLSIYMQEGILPSTDENPLGNPIVYLLQGVRFENPIADKKKHFYYGLDDDRPLGFAALNAAVSKLYGDCLLTWCPNYFPLSCYWSPYWSYNDFVTKKAHTDNQICYVTDGETSVIAPDFYSPSVQKKWTDIDGNSKTFKDKIILADKRNAALSNWTSWDGLCYYNILYSTPDDGLSTTDTLIQAIDKKSDRITEVMKLLRENIISMGGSYGAPLSAGDTGSDKQIPAVNTDGNNVGYATVAASASGSGGGSGNIKSSFLKWMVGKKKKPSDPNVSSLMNGGSGGDADDSGLSPHDSNGCSSVGAAIDKFVASGKADKIATNATTVGIPQHNPPLFGGPHGKYSSPRTPQSYFEVDNTFLRNVGRINGNTCDSFTDMDTDNYYQGLEKWCRPVYEDIPGNPNTTSRYNEFYFSPSLTMHKMQEGGWQWIWDYITYSYSVYKYFPGQIRYTTRACSSYLYYPTEEDGSPITYLSDSVIWMSAYHYQTYTTSTSWYEGAYWSYLNENSYSQLVYLSRTPYWYICSYGPYRYGYYTRTIVNWFKKFLLHNEPTVRWTITRLPMNSWGVRHNPLGDDGNFIKKLGIALGKYYSRSPEYYLTYKAFEWGTKYKLDIWNGYVHWSDQFFAGLWWRSSEAERAENKLIKNNRTWGDTIQLYFCEGTNQSYRDRFTNGPSSIFRCAVRMSSYIGLYYYPHYKCKCGKRKFCHWIPKWRPVSYVEVLPETVTEIYEQTNKDPYSTIDNEPYYFYDQPSDSVDLCEKGPFEHMSPWGGGASITDRNGGYTWSSVGLSGWGLLSNMHGLNSANITSPTFLEGNQRYEYLQNLSGPTPLATLQNQRIIDIKHYYSYIHQYNAPYCRDEYGSLNYMPGGNPEYRLAEMDAGLSKSFARIWTRYTVCKDDGRMYYASLDNAFRLLAQQIKWQLSFLKTAKELFVSTIDFDVVKKLLKNFVDPAIYNASSPVNVKDEQGLYPYDKSYYDFWIAKARALFETDPNTKNLKKLMEKAFNSRITVLENALPPLMKIASKRAYECSWNDLIAGWNQIPVINNQLKNITMEEYIMCYLEILYQYRKYFINVRFNKQDGTMWMMRHLESILDNALSAAIKVDLPSINSLAPEHSMNQIPVAFYRVTNSTADKVSAIINKSKLPEDCIHTVFVKVEYVDKEEYDEEQKQLKAEGKPADEGRIVYIKENGKYARRPPDGLYHLESQEYIDSKMNEQYNNHIAKTSVKPDQAVYFATKAIDYTSKFIYWGHRDDLTPIKFSIVTGMSVSALAEPLKSGADMSPMDHYCSCRDENDFWTVKLITYPRASGYKTNVKLVKNIDKEGLLSSSDGPEQTINGAFAYSLWPITEDQANIIPDELASALLPQEIKDQIANKKLVDNS